MRWFVRRTSNHAPNIGGRGLSRRALIRGAGLGLLATLVKSGRAEAAFTLFSSVSAPDHVQSAAIDTTGCSLIVIIAGGDYSGVGTPTDTASNVWLAVPHGYVPGFGVPQTQAEIFYCIAPTTSASHQFAGTSQFLATLSVAAYKTPGMSVAFDADNATGNSTSPGSITPALANSLVVSGYVNNSGGTPTISGGGMSVVTSVGSGGVTNGLAHNLSAPASPVNPTWSSGTTASSDIASFKLVVSPPAAQAVNYSVAYNGDMVSPAPHGIVASLSWSSGTATLTTATPHGLLIGSNVQLAVNNIGGTGGAGYQCGGNGLAATGKVTGTSMVTYPVASSPTAFSGGTTYWLVYGLNSLMGGANGDLTYYEFGACPSTAADASHIVLDGSAIAAVVGHAIQRNSDPPCIVVGFDPSNGVAMVAARAGFAATFGGTPQSGDTYTVFPMRVTITIALSTGGGSRLWQTFCVNPGNAMMPVCVKVDAANPPVIQGNWAFNQKVPLGKAADNSSAVVIKNGDGAQTQVAGTSIMALGCAVKLRNLQLWRTTTTNGAGAAGIFCDTIETLRAGGAYDIQQNVFYDEGYDIPSDVNTMWDSLASYLGNPIFANNIVVMTVGLDHHMSGISMTAKFNTIAYTGNFATTTTGTALSADTTFNVVDPSGIVQNACVDVVPHLVEDSGQCPRVDHVTGNTVTMHGGGHVSGTISPGTTVRFQGADVTSNPGVAAMVAQNNAIFGVFQPFGSGGPTLTSSVTNATDSNPYAMPGFTTVSYAAAFNSASGQGTGSIDLRLPSTSPLRGAGTYDSSVPTDIFGNARPNPPSIGAVEFIAATGSGGTSRALTGAGH